MDVEKLDLEEVKDIPIKKILLPTRGHLATETVVIGCNLAKLYNAKLTVVHVVELPYLLPLSTSLLQRETYSEGVLKRVLAIGQDKKVKVHVKTVRARSVVKAIVQLASEEDYDLVLLGSRSSQTLGPITEKLLHKLKCRVWICKPPLEPLEEGEGEFASLHRAKDESLPEDL